MGESMILRLALALALLLVASPAAAMQKRIHSAQDSTGRAIPTASVRVTIAGTSTLATLYSDNGVTALANPLTTSATDGTYSYYAANGRYTEVVTKSGYTFSVAQTYDFTLY